MQGFSPIGIRSCQSAHQILYLATCVCSVSMVCSSITGTMVEYADPALVSTFDELHRD